jgi:MFS family permease
MNIPVNSIQPAQLKQRKLVFTAAFAIIFCCSASAAFSVFAVPLQQATGATASQVALTLTIYQFFMAAFGIISGRVIDHAGPKKLMYLGGLIFGLGWFLGAFAHSLWFLYLSIGFLAGAGNGLLYNPALLTTLKWFPEKSGAISGYLLAAASLGPLVLAKVGAVLCDAMGTNGFIPIGITYFALIWLVAWLMKNPPVTQTTQRDTDSQSGVSPKEMLRSFNFWLLLILFSVACTAGIMLIGSLSSIAQVQLKLTPVVAANMVVVNTLANFCGRLITGNAVDKIGPMPTLIAVMGHHNFRFSRITLCHHHGHVCHFLNFVRRIIWRCVSGISDIDQWHFWQEILWHQLRHHVLRLCHRFVDRPANCDPRNQCQRWYQRLSPSLFSGHRRRSGRHFDRVVLIHAWHWS